jgi:hypothetical protein
MINQALQGAHTLEHYIRGDCTSCRVFPRAQPEGARSLYERKKYELYKKHTTGSLAMKGKAELQYTPSGQVNGLPNERTAPDESPQQSQGPGYA